MAACRLPRYRRFVPKAVAQGALPRTPSAPSQTKLISDEQLDVLIVLGALIALLVISAIVVWIYGSRT